MDPTLDPNALLEQLSPTAEQVQQVDTFVQDQAVDAPETPEQPPVPEAPEAQAEGPRNNRVERSALQGNEQTDALSGIGKWVEENVNIPIVDMLDSSRNAEEVAADRAEMRSEQADYANEVQENAGHEVARTVTGSVVGAVETGLEAAEVIGDSLKVAGHKIGALPEVTETDNPFNSKYEWAQWDLGKDKIGANTQIGKMAQEFGEFGLLMAGTGGFAGLQGASAAFKGAGALGKLGVAAKSGAIGAGAGFAADALQGLAGNANISEGLVEMLGENAPGFLTAIATNDQDGPWAMAIKNGLEGMPIGFAADAVGPAIGSLFVQASEAGIKGVKGIPTAQAPTPTPPKSSVPEGIELAADSQQKIMLQEQIAKGQPVTWDDVANLHQDLFTPGSRQIAEPNFAPDIYEAMDLVARGESPGFSRNPFTGEEVTDGTMVAIDGAKLDSFTKGDVEEFILNNYDTLTRDDVFLGGWKNDAGTVSIELSRRIDDPEQAIVLGKQFDQEGVFNTATKEYIGTGGADQLGKTKMDHYRSSFQKSMDNQTVPAAEVGASQARAAGMPPEWGPTSSARGLTDARIKLLADSDDAAAQLKQLNKDLRAPSLKALNKSQQEAFDSAVQNAADVLGVDSRVDLSKLSRTTYGDEKILSEEGIMAANRVMSELASRIADRTNPVLQLTDAGVEAAVPTVQMIDTLKVLMREVKQTSQLHGRLLTSNAAKNGPRGFDPAQAARQMKRDLAKAAKNEELLDAIKKGIESGDRKAKKQAYNMATALKLADGNPAKMMTIGENLRDVAAGKMWKVYFNSLLSAPTTHIVNTTSSAFNVAYRPFSAALTGGRGMKMAGAAFSGMGETLSESWHGMRQALDTGVSVKGVEIDRGAGQSAAILDELAANAEKTGDLGLQAGVGVVRALSAVADSPIFDWPSKLMMVSDEFLGGIAARQKFRMEAMSEALDLAASSGRKTDDVFNDLIKAKYDLNFGKKGEILDDTLIKVTDEINFRNELEGWAKSMQDLSEKNPIARVFMPFVRTGHNIMVFGLENSPMAPFTKEFQQVMKTGTEVEKRVMKGRMGFGSMVTMSAGMAAMTGAITGSGPADYKERQEWLKNNEPRSFNLTKMSNGLIKGENGKDKFLSYNRIEPFGFILNSVADIVEGVRRYDLTVDKGQFLASYISYAVAANLTQKSFYQGLIPLGQMLTPGWQGASTLASWPVDTVNNFIPMASMRRTLNRLFAPYQRDFKDRFERSVDSMLPFPNKGVDKIDWLTGEPLQASSGGLNALSPLNAVDRGGSVVLDALEDMQFNSDTIIKEMGGVELTPEQRQYIHARMAASGLHKKLEDTVTQPWWRNELDSYYEEIQDGGDPGPIDRWNFHKVVRQEITKARDLAKKELLQEYPDLSTEMYGNKARGKKSQAELLKSLITY